MFFIFWFKFFRPKFFYFCLFSPFLISNQTLIFAYIFLFNYRIAEEKKNEGNDHYKAQNYQMALRLYSDAINLCPEAAAFYGNRAACHMMLGDYKSALHDSRQAVSIDDKFEKGYVRIAKCCLALGDIVGTEQTVKKLLEIDAKSIALKAEAQHCKQLRSLDEKAYQCYDKNDYRTAGESFKMEIFVE